MIVGLAVKGPFFQAPPLVFLLSIYFFAVTLEFSLFVLRYLSIHFSLLLTLRFNDFSLVFFLAQRLRASPLPLIPSKPPTRFRRETPKFDFPFSAVNFFTQGFFPRRSHSSSFLFLLVSLRIPLGHELRPILIETFLSNRLVPRRMTPFFLHRSPLATLC